MFEIQKTLVIGLAHCPEKDADIMADHGNEDIIISEFICDAHPFGHIVYLTDDIKRHILEDKIIFENRFTTEFINVLRLGIELGVDYIRFDSDGPLYPFLPHYNWC